MNLPLTIHSAKVVSGAGRGRKLGIPTINVDPSCAPEELSQGIYACFAVVGDKKYMGAMHYGPRPVFHDSFSLEVHIIDAVLETVPETIDLSIVSYIRDVQDFPTTEALLARIEKDIHETRAILHSP